MGKLLTEDSVRQLMKQNKLIDRGSLTLPRGTILTPSARSFLAEHQIKIGSGRAEATNEPLAKQIKHNPWLSSLAITQGKVDFDLVAYYRTPLFQLRTALREQGVLCLALLQRQDASVDQNVVTNMVLLVNNLLAVTPDQVAGMDEFPWDAVKLETLKLKGPQRLIGQQIAIGTERVATALADYLVVQPEFSQTIYYQAVVRWQKLVQTWLQSIWKVGEDDARSK
ncbi:MAG TPA: hypothetical protein H9875_02370 [Candidatus Levilactobacillus faecigallinarum]|uniref:Uncharacterized protein n=1 Tax=Candidatus Levilactobacillus faecigallinarum TaxID=2838638 RepID=A0A9D1QSI1_9LACO|nr:hypothetical protein [Candidatus Levilactobacillus faecigallinarum]